MSLKALLVCKTLNEVPLLLVLVVDLCLVFLELTVNQILRLKKKPVETMV